jgi:hypothetical protein
MTLQEAQAEAQASVKNRVKSRYTDTSGHTLAGVIIDTRADGFVLVRYDHASAPVVSAPITLTLIDPEDTHDDPTRDRRPRDARPHH